MPCASVPERVALPAGLKAASWLRLAGADGARIAPELDRRCGELSKGQLQRVALSGALAAAVAPSVLVLDEPSTGLDSDARLALAAQLAEIARNGSA